MPDKRQYSTTAVSFPGGTARFKDVSACEITVIVPRVANREYGDGDGDELGWHEAQQRRGIANAVETDAKEPRAGETRDVSSRPGRLLTPPFGLFLRAALLAHLERTFR